MKIIINSIASFIILLFISACSDIIDCGNYDKEYLFKTLTPADSLEMLDIRALDFGSLKMMSISTKSVRLINSSDKHFIAIYSISSLNTSGVFTYKYPSGIPFIVGPSEDTEVSGKITAKFNASVFNTGYYYDTLIFNNDTNFKLPVKAFVRY